MELIRQDRNEDGKIDLNIRVNFKTFEQIQKLSNILEGDKELIKFSIYETKILF